MKVSSPDVKQFLLELIEHSNYPGKLLEFVLEVKKEVLAADIGDVDVTASDRMLSHKTTGT
jgi:hypothetical protein